MLNASTQKPLSLEERSNFAANALRHMGLRDKFSRLNVIVDMVPIHQNNAFGSALDCGACGGHAGDINARFLVSLLNDSKVRAQLSARGIEIPNTSWFVAAVHETVTDEIYLLEEESIPASYRGDLDDLKSSLKRAAVSCRTERQTARAVCLDSSAKRRSTNWSEVRPGVGLSGNACFIVAPRNRTLELTYPVVLSCTIMIAQG